MKIDKTGLRPLEQTLDGCLVVAVPGPAPADITIELPFDDGARVLARWQGFPAGLQVGQYVAVQRRTTGAAQYVVVGASGATVEPGGDMLKADYDADDDGVVDQAATAPWAGITGKPSTFPPDPHTHDDRYYTETEMDTALAGKADTGHLHDDRYYTEAEVDALLAGGGGTDEKVKISATDTSAGFLGDKIVAGDGIGLGIVNGGGSEQLLIAATDEQVLVSLNDTDNGYLATKLAAGDNVTLTVLNPGAAEQLQVSVPGSLVKSGDAAGGVLAGTYPDPSFAVDMATQAELNSHTSAPDPHPNYLLRVDLTSEMADAIHSTPGKNPPVDDDELPLVDSASGWSLRRLTWANLKATLQTYFNTLYSAIGHLHDDRYYTEAEVDTALAGKAATVHEHTVADITDLQTDTLVLTRVRLLDTTEVDLSSANHGIQIGNTSGANLAMATNEVQARSNGAAAALDLNPHGGDVRANGTKVLSGVSANRPGVTRLYRRDDDSGYSVQTHWTGSHWWLRGYDGSDNFHAECRVDNLGGYSTTQMKSNGSTVRRTNNMNITASSWTVIPWESYLYNTASLWNGSTRLTAARTGWHIAVASVNIEQTANSNNNGLRILLNGSTIVAQQNDRKVSDTGNTPLNVASPPLYLNAGDYLELQALSVAAAYLQANNASLPGCLFGLISLEQA